MYVFIECSSKPKMYKNFYDFIISFYVFIHYQGVLEIFSMSFGRIFSRCWHDISISNSMGIVSMFFQTGSFYDVDFKAVFLLMGKELKT